MKKLFEFLSKKIIPFGTIFLLFFIPVYPKLPIFDVLGTWVYIRLEDFLVAILIGLFLATKVYEKRFSDSRLTFPILFYWIIGALSVVFSLVFIGPKLSNYFPHLTVLHYLRRIEYMMLFFLAYETVARNEKRLNLAIWAIAIAVATIVIYGIGQKFIGFPAYLTMNEEFAKGVPLRLPPTARIVSTFGGHYDLAAYLVLVIPILGSLVFGLGKLWQKGIFFLLTFGAVILLLFTASRVSFGVYLIAISSMLFWQKKRILIPAVIIVSFILLNFVSGASERFYKTFRFSDVVVDLSTGKPIGTLEKLEGGNAVIEEIESPDEESLPKGSSYISVPPIGTKVPGQKIETVELVVSRDLATGSGEVATISGSFLIQKALVYDISITTRFQGQWPRAMAAFGRNILLGSGYSTLSLAVDGNYHRMLGETGILGAIAYLGILALAFSLFLKGKNDLTTLHKAFVIGFFAGVVGLLFNAVLIDVFEASKVAYTLWILMGISLAILAGTKWKKDYFSYLGTLFTSNIAYMFYLVFVVAYLYRSVLSGYFIGDDFTWLRWGAQSSLADIPKYFTQSSGFFYRPIPKLWYFALYSVFWLKSVAYHVVSLMLYSVICLLLYSLLRASKVHRNIALLSALFFGGLSVHHENVFWISGYSSLLGTLFLLFALRLLFWRNVLSRQLLNWCVTILIYLVLFLSMLSYDSLVVAPIVFVVCSIGIFGNNKRWVLGSLVLIPIYWFFRSLAGAVVPSGDYGYKIATFPVNSVANTIGYFIASFLGPLVIEQMAQVRTIMRQYLFVTTVTSVSIGAVLLFVAYRAKSALKKYSVSFVWLGAFFISTIPFAGLGGMAERYAFAPSAFLILGLASAVAQWGSDGNQWKRLGFALLFFIGLLLWNTREISRLAGHWRTANYISQQTLLKIKSEYFPLTVGRTIFFVDIPIRFGRSWIFPTGLGDALWHLFREAPYVVVQAASVDQAFAYPVTESIRTVLRFENYELKQLVTETKVIDKNENK